MQDMRQEEKSKEESFKIAVHNSRSQQHFLGLINFSILTILDSIKPIL